MNNRFVRATTTTTVTKQKAKNPLNQAGLDKLQEVYDKASSNPNSNYVFTVRRAMKSLQSCPTAITTQKEACQLKYVGPAVAKVICPTFLPSPTSSTNNYNNNTNNNDSNTQQPSRKRSRKTAASSTVEQGPSKKEKVYKQERLAAESLDLSNCGPWKVILIIDGREHKSQHVVSKCKQSGIPCEERNLPIGDMAWIAQAQDKISGRTTEVLCGTIVERKESSDLVGSLFGSRYLEQRMRLKSCGVPQLLFLVEGNLASNINCPQETLEMAIMETRCLGFHVIQTENLMDTVRKLKGLHRRVLQRTFPEAFSQLPTYTRSPTGTFGLHRKRRPTSLLEMTFDTTPKPALGAKRFITYTELKAKVELDREAGTRTVGAIYMAMLKQISTLSHKKCEALAKIYPTMNALMTAYATSDNPAKMIQDISLGTQKMGPKSSEAVYTAICTQRDGTRPNGPTMEFEDIPVAKKSPTSVGPPAAANTYTGALDSFFAPKAPSPPKAKTASMTVPGSAALAALKKPASQSYSPPSPDRKPAPSVLCVDLTDDTPPRPSFAKKPSYLTDPPPSTGSSAGYNKSSTAALKGSIDSQKATPKAAPKTAVQLNFSSPLFSSPDDDDSLLHSAPFAKRPKTSTLDVALARSVSSTPSPAASSTASNSSTTKKKAPAVAAKAISSPSIVVMIDSSDEEDDDELLMKKPLQSKANAPSTVAAKAAEAAAAATYSIPSSSPNTIRRVSDGSSISTASSSTTTGAREVQQSKKPTATFDQTTANVTMRRTNKNSNPPNRWQDALDSDYSDDEDDLGISLDLRSRLAKRSNTETIVID
ncbi:unnamed protein product [Cylindrotheca closterium]|uniref:Crossover junction endonuclease MUS81 n=1 Tax=Cylindrotheca closterium TaxID=2856 RepID=A0AAD2G0R1_9STRA|nr:unnamed protein product [Cylindrotheca closterium]